MHLIVKSSGYHTLNFIATDLQLYEIFKITRVSFLGHSSCNVNYLSSYTEDRTEHITVSTKYRRVTDRHLAIA